MVDIPFPLHSFFAAVPLERDAKHEFQRIVSLLQPYEEILCFQNIESPHLTLQYWPEVMEIEYRRIVEQTAALTDKFSPFKLKVSGIETFAMRGEDRVLFLTVPFSEELARLKKACPWPSVKPFSPHITIARMRHPQRFAIVKKKIMKILKDIEFVMHVDRVRLYAFVQGKRQTPLVEYMLKSNIE